MPWLDPATMTEEQIKAEINALKPKVVEWERYHRRRWELLQELGLRHQRAAQAQTDQPLGGAHG